MSQEQRFSGRPVLEGCLVSWACMFVLMLSVSLVFTTWLGLISSDTERVVGLFVWLFAICLGGYYAARRGKPTGWTNALAVGVIAELFVLARLPKEQDDSVFPKLFGPLLEMINDPGAHWRPLVSLALTIPVAILGGLIWEKTRGGQLPGQISDPERRP